MISEIATSSEIAPEIRHIPEELRVFAHSGNFAGLAILSFFASNNRYPDYVEFERTMQAILVKEIQYSSRKIAA